MRRRALLASGAAATTTALAGCGGFLGGGGPSRTAGGYFVLQTAKHNDVQGQYLIDGISHNGGVVESFEGGTGDLEEARLDSTQSYEAVSRDAKDGEQSLLYTYGVQESRQASNSRGVLHRPMAVEGTTELSLWARQTAIPEDDFRLGWGFAGVDQYALAFDLNRETTGQIHVQTNAGSGTNRNLGIGATGEWTKYEFVDLDWNAGTATARVESAGGEELATMAVEFVPPSAETPTSEGA